MGEQRYRVSVMIEYVDAQGTPTGAFNAAHQQFDRADLQRWLETRAEEFARRILCPMSVAAWRNLKQAEMASMPCEHPDDGYTVEYKIVTNELVCRCGARKFLSTPGAQWYRPENARDQRPV